MQKKLNTILNHLSFILFHSLPLKKNKVLFISHLGKSYSCNPKYLCEYLAKYYDNEIDIVWVYSGDAACPKDLPSNVRTVHHFSRRYLYEISTAHYVVSNTRITDWFMFEKRKGQIYIQTWHSSLRLKCIEADAGLPDSYILAAKKDSSKIDYIISGCELSTNIFQKSFWYDGPILKTGTPRIDYLLNITSQEKLHILEKAGLSNEYRYVLYAPTFRKNNDLSAYNIKYDVLISTLKLKFGGKWKVLFRLHPNLKDVVSVEQIGKDCIDVTQYGDMQELLCISDILITDYSSSMFDMAYLKKLCILYTSDLDKYLSSERKLYFNLKALPFVVVKDNLQLQKAIEKFDKTVYDESVFNFMKQIGSYEDGNACKRITRSIFNL